MASEEEILHKVRSLLAKAESTTYEPESMACMEKAHELMRTYSLDRAVVESHNTTYGKTSHNITFVVIELDPPYTKAKHLLLTAIARNNSCQTVKSGKKKYIYGLSHDLRYVQILYTSLILQAIESMIDKPTPYGESTKSYRNSFLIGFAIEVDERLKAINKGVEDDNKQAVVLLRDIEADIKAVVSDAFPSVKNMTYSYSSSRGLTDGKREGMVADIGQSGVEGMRGEISG